MIDPIQSFLNGGQRAIYDEAADLLAASANNLGYLPAGSDAEVKRMLDDPNAFRGNRMTQLKQAAEALGKQIEEALATNRAVVVEAIEGRKSRGARQRLLRQRHRGGTGESRSHDRPDHCPGRQREADRAHPRAGEQLRRDDLPVAARPARILHPAHGRRPTDPEPKPVKQTVSVKTITAPGVHGVLESPEDVDRYLDALRGALLSTLNDGKRIAL